MEEMGQSGFFLVTLLAALFFTLLYGEGFAGGGMGRALRFGVYYGLAVGLAWGVGMYLVLPIQAALSAAWLMSEVVLDVAAAVLLYWVYGRFGARA
jgi:hypothetical protein